MSKYDDRAARALDDLKNDCGHPPQSRSVDAETADEFCGDCGRVTQTYVPGMAGRFPRNRATELIAEKLKAEFPDHLEFIHVFHVDPMGRDKFECYVQATVSGELQHRYYTLTREGADENVQVI